MVMPRCFPFFTWENELPLRETLICTGFIPRDLKTVVEDLSTLTVRNHFLNHVESETATDWRR